MENLNIAFIDEEAKRWDVTGALYASLKGKEVLDRIYNSEKRKEAKEKACKNTRYPLPLYGEMFIAISILQLCERGLLSLEDKLDKFIPAYPLAKHISIRQLLQHESGLPDYFRGISLVKLQNDEKYKTLSTAEQVKLEKLSFSKHFTMDEMLEMLSDKELLFTPGSRKAHFSQTELFLLGEVIKRISKMELFDYINKNILLPIGVSDACFEEKNSIYSGIYINGTQYVPIENKMPIKDTFTLSIESLAKLTNILNSADILGKEAWEKALNYNDQGIGIGFKASNGTVCSSMEVLGFELKLYFEPENSFAYMFASCDGNSEDTIGGEWRSFLRSVRGSMDSFTTYPIRTTLKEVNALNIWYALELEVTKEQLFFVDDAKSSIACAYAEKERKKAFVLEENGRAVGLCVLLIDAEHEDFGIDIVLIDIKYQHRGFGRIMLIQALEKLKQSGAKEIEIGVARENVPAQNLYRSLGFENASVFDDWLLLKMQL